MTVITTKDIVGFKQQIAAGSNFNGAAPVGAPVALDGLFVFPEEAVGGLFEPQVKESGEQGIRVMGIELELADQSSWSIARVDRTGGLVVRWSGTTEGSFVTGEGDGIVLLDGEKMKLTTVGATAAMKATIKFASTRLVTVKA